MTLDTNTSKSKILFLIALFVFVLYGNSIRNGYALDDDYVTVTTPGHPQNTRIAKGIRGIPELFTTHYFESKDQKFEYRPLVLASFAIEYQFFGSNPGVSHFINVLLYAITCCLLYLLLLKVFRTHHLLFPLLVTLLFAAHPIHTEVVASIKSRDELLSFLFGISAFWFILKYLETRKAASLALAVLLLLAALLCKLSAVLFIALIPFTLYFFSFAALKKAIAVCLYLSIALACSLLLEHTLTDSATTSRTFAFFENPLFYEHSFGPRLPMALYASGYYLKLLVLPYPLSCYYGYSAIPFASWGMPFVLLSLAAYIAIAAYAFKQMRSRHVMSYAILFYLGAILPFSNLISLATGIVAERYIYLASLAFCIGLGWLLLALFKTSPAQAQALRLRDLKPGLLLSMLIIFSAYAFKTVSRNAAWKDELTLFRTDSKTVNNSCNLHYITGNKLYTELFRLPDGPAKDSVLRETKFHFQKALNLMREGVKHYPEDYTTLNNIGTIYVNIFNDAAAAQPYFRQSLAVKKDNATAQYNFAYCYERLNMPDSAIAAYERMISDSMAYPPLYAQLRELYLKKQSYGKAVLCDRHMVESDPKNAMLRVNLGNDLLLAKDTLDGIAQFETAVKLEPANDNLRTQIVSFLKSAGYTDRANALGKKP